MTEMTTAELLLEIGTEEIPAWMLEAASMQLARELQARLRSNRLPSNLVAAWYTPRRIVVSLDGIPVLQEDLEENLIGPPRSIGFDANGNPTRAAEAFARKAGVPPSELRILSTPKGEYVSAVRRVPGQPTKEILRGLIPAAIGSLQFPKGMVWSPDRFRFARPLRWILAVYEGKAVRFALADVESDCITRGHRFAGRGGIRAVSLAELEAALEENGVILDPAKREARICAALEREAALCGGTLLADPDLLRTVVNLNELPAVIHGRFEERFLDLPQEILVTVMREHQKYFSLLDGTGRLLPAFLAVVNIGGDPSGKIRAGHERVLRARLADAEFFWRSDRRCALVDRLESLRKVLFQEKLGSYHDKTERILRVLPKLAVVAGESERLLDDLQVAGRICKCDLVTDMVKEFTDLQGIVGGLYARAEGKAESVWRAVYEQYLPKSTASPSPTSRSGALLALADRLDTVCGCFLVGLVPSGSKDPFAVRRQANGIIKILLDHRIDASLAELVGWGLEAHGACPPEVLLDLRRFLEGRVRFLLEEAGYSYDCLNAAQAAGFDRPLDARSRVSALQEVHEEQDFLAVASNFKRIVNILEQADAGDEGPNPSLLSEPEERALWQAYLSVDPVVAEARTRHDYRSVFRSLASLRGAVDLFFDRVLVMSPDAAIRSNRLALLRRLSRTFREVADVSQIVLERG